MKDLLYAGGSAELEAWVPRSDSDWAITPELSFFLARLVLEDGRRSLLEFGAGTSSLLLGRALERAGGGRLTSVEHKPEHSVDAWGEVERLRNVDARLVASPLGLRLGGLRPMWVYTRAADALAARAPYDLVLIDAPPRRYRRDGPMHMARPHLAPGALVVLDDAARPEERASVEGWLDRYAELELVLHDVDFGGKGVAVLRRGGDAPAVTPRGSGG